MDDLPALVAQPLEARAHASSRARRGCRRGRWRPSRPRRATPAAPPRRRVEGTDAGRRQGQASSATSARRYACAARRSPASCTGSSTTTSPDCRSTEPTRARLLRDEETVGAVAPPPPHGQDIFHVCIIGTRGPDFTRVDHPDVARRGVRGARRFDTPTGHERGWAARTSGSPSSCRSGHPSASAVRRRTRARGASRTSRNAPRCAPCRGCGP